ncbi:MAG: matrixin family metalloprotease [Gemmatimonadetes bacterium]|nr:matrixin family metalloprotease [Gemmatimonadota bacterium]
MRRAFLLIAAGLPLFWACEASPPLSPADGRSAAVDGEEVGDGSPGTTTEWVEDVFVDYAGLPSHAGPGPHPDTESNRFHLIQGGIHWFAGGTVKYRILGTEPVLGGSAAVEAAVDTWDGFITTRDFFRNDAETEQLNPCRSIPNTAQWAAIDGAGGVVAEARVCRNKATKEILGFFVTMDRGEAWSTVGAASTFDVENVAAHEFGHAAGLDHVNAPRDGCLTLYFLVASAETQKRTPGLGDKLGMNALYGSLDVDAGACGS